MKSISIPQRFAALFAFILWCSGAVLADAPKSASTHPTEADFVAAVYDAGGRIERDEGFPEKPIIAVDFEDRHGELLQKALLSMRAISTIQVLNLANTRISDDDLQQISQLHGVRSLNLTRTQVSNRGLEFLRGWDQLEHIECPMTKITGEGLAILASHRQLKMIFLPYRMDAANLEALSQLPGPLELDFSGTHQTDAELVQLSKMQNVGTLRFFCNGEMNDGAIAHLAAMPHLQELGINAECTDEGLRILASSPELRKLRIYARHTTPAGIGALSKLKSLRELQIDASHFANNDIAVIAPLTKLRFLKLEFARHLDNRAVPLFSSFRELRTLDVTGSGITAAGSKELRRLLPSTQVIGPK